MSYPAVIIKNEITNEVESSNSGSKQVEIQESSPLSSMPLIDVDFMAPLSEPYIHFTLTKSHVKPLCHMVFPTKIYPDLPSSTGPALTIPTTLVCQGKSWETTLVVTSRNKRLDNWKVFVDGNKLKLGDALFWELLESSNEKVKFKVQIIRGDFPAELAAKVDGSTTSTPIIVDD